MAGTTSIVARRTQQERSRSTRAALLKAAVRCILRLGYAETTTSEIAKEAGLTRGAVQHHFKDRDDLMGCVIEIGWRDLEGRIRGISEAEGGLRERVDAVIDRMWESYSSDAVQAAFAISYARRGEPAIQAAHERFYRSSGDALDVEWRRLFKDTDASHKRLRMCRRMARSTLAGLVQQLALDPRPDEVLPADIDFLKQAIFVMLSAPEREESLESRYK